MSKRFGAINNVTISGNVVDDPDFMYTANDKPRLAFTVAIDPPFNPDGTPMGGTTYVDVVAWNVIAERAADLTGILVKGASVIVVGAINTYRPIIDDDGSRGPVRFQVRAHRLAADVFNHGLDILTTLDEDLINNLMEGQKAISRDEEQ